MLLVKYCVWIVQGANRGKTSWRLCILAICSLIFISEFTKCIFQELFKSPLVFSNSLFDSYSSQSMLGLRVLPGIFLTLKACIPFVTREFKYIQVTYTKTLKFRTSITTLSKTHNMAFILHIFINTGIYARKSKSIYSSS